MPISKLISASKRSLPALSLVLYFNLLACHLPSPQSTTNQGGDKASFLVESKEPKVTEQKTLSGFSVPESKTFHFEVCIRDLKQARPILNHQFKITGQAVPKESQLRTTDANGCLNWDENIKFNFFGDAKFITLPRTITAQGIQKGTRTILYAVNPWEGQAYDLEKTKIDNLVAAEQSESALKSALSSLEQKNMKSILATDIRVSLVEKQTTDKGTTLNLELRGSPSVELKKSSGMLSIEPINEGLFEAQVHLIHVFNDGKKETRHEVFRSQSLSLHSTNGQLSLQVPLTLTNYCTKGQYQLGLKLIAKLPASHPQLAPFEGVFYLSECDQIKGSFFAVLNNEATKKGATFNLESYLKETPMLAESSPTQPSQITTMGGLQKAQFEIMELKASDLSYKDQDSLHREREFYLQACLASGLDAKTLRAQNFTIKKANGSTEQLLSNNQGCIKWQDSVKFNYLSRECELKQNVEISSEILGIKQTIPLLINPWSQNPNAIRDIRFVTASQQTAKCASGQPQVVMNQFEFKRSKFQYAVDDFMNLIVKKTGNLSLNFEIKRPSLTEPSGFAHERAPVANYRLRVALLDIDTKVNESLAKKVFMVTEKQERVQGLSTLVAEFTLEADNLKEIGNTALIWIELTPVEMNSQLKPVTYQGSFTMSENFEGGNLVQLPELDESYIDRAAAARLQDLQAKQRLLSKLGDKTAIAKDLGLELLILNDEKTGQYLQKNLNTSAAEMKTWLIRGELSAELAVKFCDYWINDRFQRPHPQTGKTALRTSMPLRNFMQTRCLSLVREKPSKFFDLQYRYLVNKPKVLAQRDGVFHDFTSNVSFNMGRAFSENHSLTHSVDVGVNISARSPEFLGAAVGLNGGYRYSSSWVKQWSEQTATQVSFNSGLTMAIETVSLKLQAQSLEKCAIIKLKSELYLDNNSMLKNHLDPKLNPRERADFFRSGLMVCSGEPSKTPMDFVENYYVMNQRINGGHTLDATSSHNRPFFVALRGDHDFSSFVSFLHADSGIPESFRSEFQSKELLRDRSKALFLKGLPGSPGQLISPR